MSLPLKPPFMPMEAKIAKQLPQGSQWQYEPKWDGFRCLAFRDGNDVELQSKAGKPLARYFPELVSAVAALDAKQFVLDGEIIIPIKNVLSFDDLLQRIHPAESRIKKLSHDRPAMFIVFDLLVDDRGRSLVGLHLSERRVRLEAFAAKYLHHSTMIRLSPATRDLSVARQWFRTVGGGLDGIVAKRLDMSYQTGERTGMQKIKKIRTADCVVGGFRYASKDRVVGSLLLGLYDEDGLLHHVGFTSGFKDVDREKLTRRLEKLIEPPGFTGQAPGGPSRWASERSGEWEPLASKLVAEVEYDHFTGGRFRHGTKFLRWRPDKPTEQCTLKQVTKESRSPLVLL